MAVPLVLAATNNNWTINLGLFAVSYFLCAICWAFINPTNVCTLASCDCYSGLKDLQRYTVLKQYT